MKTPRRTSRFIAARALPALLLAALALGLAACQINPLTKKRELNFMSWEEEKRLGDEAVAPILAQLGGEYPDPALKAYVDRVGRAVAAEGRKYVVRNEPGFPDWDFRFYVVNDSLVNAFALPGGHVFVTRGILNAMDSEAQLAGLLGHECSHVYGRHSASRQAQSLAVLLPVIVLGAALDKDDAWIAALSGVAAQLLVFKYSRDHESQADEYGMTFSVGARYEADGIIELMGILERAGGGGGLEFLSTHPSPDNRIAVLTRQKEAMYPGAVQTQGYVKGQEPFSGAMLGVRKAEKAYALVDRGDKAAALAAQKLKAGDTKNVERLLSDALSHYRSAARDLPGHGLIQRKVGETLLARGKPSEALAFLSRARELDGADFYEDYLYGVALHHSDRHAEALVAFEASLRVAPENPAALTLAGDSAAALDQRSRAHDSWLKAYAMLGDNAEKTRLADKIVALGYPSPAPPTPAKGAASGDGHSGGGEHVAEGGVIYVDWHDRAGLCRALGGISGHEHDDDD